MLQLDVATSTGSRVLSRLSARPFRRLRRPRGVRAGLGVAALPNAVSAGLVRLVPRASVPSIPLWLALHPELRREPHVRAFVDEVQRSFRAAS